MIQRPRKTARKVRNRPEQDQQIALFRWAKMAERQYPALKLLFHVPNGGMRNVREAGILKAMGVKKGVPDVWLPVAGVLSRRGLVLEFKAPGTAGRQSSYSDDQLEWFRELEHEGYAVYGVDDWNDARTTLLEHLAPARAPQFVATDLIEDRLIGAAFGSFDADATLRDMKLFASLHTGAEAPRLGADSNEAAYTGYQRVEIPRDGSVLQIVHSPAFGGPKMFGIIEFPECGSGGLPSVITHWALLDGDGSVLFHDALPVGILVTAFCKPYLNVTGVDVDTLNPEIGPDDDEEAPNFDDDEGES